MCNSSRRHCSYSHRARSNRLLEDRSQPHRLGKANLGEWANFRDDEAETYPLAVGWSARGGSTNNAYAVSYTSWGSSSGAGHGAAANLCAAAIGTETDGSITGPSAVENIVGLKQAVGLISQDGIVP